MKEDHLVLRKEVGVMQVKILDFAVTSMRCLIYLIQFTLYLKCKLSFCPKRQFLCIIIKSNNLPKSFHFFPNQECKNAQLVNSASRICTGHMTRAPSEYIFQVNREQLKNSDGEEFTGVVFDAVEYIGGIQRPLAKGLDSQGRLRTITS